MFLEKRKTAVGQTEYALQVNRFLKHRVPLMEYQRFHIATNFASIVRPNGSKTYIITLGRGYG